MKKNIVWAVAIAAGVVGGSALGADPQTIGSVAATAADSTTEPIISLILGCCYLMGAFFGIKALLQMKEHTSNPNQVKIGAAITSMVICTLLLSMPTLLNMLMSTLGLGGAEGANAGPIGNLASLIGQSNVPQGCGGAGGGGALNALANNIGFGAKASAAAGGMDDMMCAFASSVPGIMYLVILSGYMAGIFLIFRGVLMLKEVNEGRVPMSKAVWTIISGIGLWAIWPMINTAIYTLGGGTADATIFTQKYMQMRDGSAFDKSINADLLFVQLLGAITFFRGMLMLKAMGENKDGSFGRAATHIFGGAAALNISWSVAILAHSIGASAAICGLSSGICAF